MNVVGLCLNPRQPSFPRVLSGIHGHDVEVIQFNGSPIKAFEDDGFSVVGDDGVTIVRDGGFTMYCRRQAKTST